MDALLIDSREHRLQTLLTCTVSTLPVGDIWIGVSNNEILENGVILERKSVTDLEASILDSRYREQRSRLLSYSSEKKVCIGYIIEGNLDKSTGRLEKKALLKHLTRLTLRYHIPVFYTTSIEETADLCKCIAEQWKEDTTAFKMPEKMTYVETRGSTRQENTDDPSVFAVSVLKCCRGVSHTGAYYILKELGSLSGVMNATPAQIAAIKVGKQKFGDVKAKRLHDLLTNTNIKLQEHTPTHEKVPMRPLFQDD